MNFILFLFLLGTAGPHAEATPFDTLEECETARAKILPAIEEFNFKDGDKIHVWTSACVQVLKAPQGKGV